MRTDLGTALRAAKSERTKQESNQVGNEESLLENNQASEKENDKTSLQQNKKTILLAQGPPNVSDSVELVGMSIKVPKSHRLHWLIAAKREGSNLTAVITQALTERYGLPTDDK